MVSLRADGVIVVLCPVMSDSLAGIAVMDLPVDDARALMAGDPCVQAGMIDVDVQPCAGFPGDTIPAAS